MFLRSNKDVCLGNCLINPRGSDNKRTDLYQMLAVCQALHVSHLNFHNKLALELAPLGRSAGSSGRKRGKRAGKQAGEGSHRNPQGRNYPHFSNS